MLRSSDDGFVDLQVPEKSQQNGCRMLLEHPTYTFFREFINLHMPKIKCIIMVVEFIVS